MPRLTVIIPVHNGAPWIGEALASVLRQSFRDLEAVVVDDGSTDPTREAVAAYLPSGKVRYFRREGREGPGSARNLGIEKARGEYVAFLDADDSLTGDSIERRMRLILAHPPLAMVFSNYIERTGDGIGRTAIGDALPDRVARVARRVPEGIVFDGGFPLIFEVPFLMWTGTIVIARRVFREIGGFRTDISIGEDRDMWLRAVEHLGAVGYVDAPLAFYNRYRGILTASDPVAYAARRKALNEGFLERYGRRYGRRTVARVVNRRISWIYGDLGSYYLVRNARAKGLYYLLKSLYFDPGNGLSFRWAASSLVPGILKKPVKRLLSAGRRADAPGQ